MKLPLEKIRERLSYTNRDYASILQNIISIIQSNEYQTSWNNLSEGDPLMLFIHLLSGHSDILNYQIDYAVLESFLSTARERASAIRYANSFGYRVPSYKAPFVEAVIDNFNYIGGRPESLEIGETLSLKPWTTFSGATTRMSWVYIDEEKQFQLDYKYYINTSLEEGYVFVDNAWESSDLEVGSSFLGSPVSGSLWFDTNTNTLKVYSGSSWVESSEPYYYGATAMGALLPFGATIKLYQGISESTVITASEWSLGGGTVILNNSNIAIGNNKTLNLLSRVYDQTSDVYWKQVSNMDQYTGEDPNVYELSVDTAGITYVRFHPSKILTSEVLYINFLVTSGVISSISDNLLTSNLIYTNLVADDSNVPVLSKTTVSSFVDGSNPLSVGEIRAAFKKYIAYSKNLGNLRDYHYYILNDREVVDGINRVNVSSTEESSNEYVGKPSGTEGTIYVVPSISSDNLSSDDKSKLLEELNSKKSPYITIVIEDPSDLVVNLSLSYYPPLQKDIDNIKNTIKSYINGKDIGTSLTKEEIINHLLEKHKAFYVGYTSSIVTLSIESGDSATLEVDGSLLGKYNCRFSTSIENIT